MKFLEYEFVGLFTVCVWLSILQWYPGHIMKTEKELREQLKLMDVVIEVRDARIPLSTTHPKVCGLHLKVLDPVLD